MTTSTGYQPPATDPGGTLDSVRRWGRDVSRSVQQIQRGGLNVSATLTLATSTTSTTLYDPRLTVGGNVLLTPMTANAAAELGNGTLYVTSADMNHEAWTFTHANNGQTDRTFRVTIIG